ncbi:MAG TPA: hypothetical protein VIY86_12340 [Pirellulaceae bacterium]
MKKTLTKTIPGFEWVAEDLCADCLAEAHSGDGQSNPADSGTRP